MPQKNLHNPAFTEQVRIVVASIPAGTTWSYQQVAAAAGRPKAARAVATIMRKNYDPDIPCHRVIRSDGSLGDYNRGGEAGKRDRLIKEGWIPKPV
jgi:methylated-DNA-[protein]-cysteine S-methyltransferase